LRRHSDEQGLYRDAAFPWCATALYRASHEPPRGAAPAESVGWNRVYKLQVRGLHSPSLECSGGVRQGCLQNRWLVSALNLLAGRPDLVARLLVGTELVHKGICTVKLFKQGAWVYVHIDDVLPC
ncbi:unnamed protein product, partial [Chrysoparadoxa australica]